VSIPRMNRRALLGHALLAGTAGLAGCSVLPEHPYQERHEYPLVLPPPEAATPTPPAGARVVLVRSLRAGPGLDARGLRTIRPDGTEDLAFWEEWAVPPPQAIEDAIRAWLAASGHFAAVIGPGSEATPDYVLEGELTFLAADQARGQARAAASLVLLRHGTTNIPVLQRVCEGTAPLTGPLAAARATAMLSAAAAMLGQIQVVVTQAV